VSTPGATPTGAGHVNALSGGSGGGGGGGSGGAAGGGAMRRASLLPAAAVGVAGVNATAASVGGAVGRRASLTASVSTSTSLGNGGGSSSVHGGLGRALQLDLDRLFAAKIVCVPNTLHVEKLSHSLFAGPGDDTSGGAHGAGQGTGNGSGNGSGNGGGGVVAVSVEVILGAILKVRFGPPVLAVVCTLTPLRGLYHPRYATGDDQERRGADAAAAAALGRQSHAPAATRALPAAAVAESVARPVQPQRRQWRRRHWQRWQR
jgi:hypothetical protein